MIVRDIDAVVQDSVIQVSAAIQLENSSRMERLWFQVPGEYQSDLLKRGEPWLAALLLPAMKLNERLMIEAPVSKQLYDQISRIQDIFLSWIKGLKRISVQGADLNPGVPSGNHVASFFSGGVDSFYTMLKNQATASEVNPLITHLLFVDGFDIKVENQKFANTVYERICYVAEKQGKVPVRIKTNLRAFSDPLINWNFYHGAALASVALMLAGTFKQVFIPATHSFQDLRPYGSHPLLDPLWSTEHCKIVHDGCESTRTEKVIQWISRSDVALETLRVCWKNPNNSYNCSVCEKCLRTMIALAAGGALDKCRTFQPLNLQLVKKMRIKNLGFLKYATDNLKSLPNDTEFNRKLRASLETAIRRNRFRLARKVWLGKRI